MSEKTQAVELIKVLLRLHRRFLTLERLAAEKHFEKSLTPYEFFHLLTQDDHFAWLRPFSAMLADVDAFTEDVEITTENKNYVTTEIQKVLALPKIQQRYERHLKEDEEFMNLHNDFTKVLRSFES